MSRLRRCGGLFAAIVMVVALGFADVAPAAADTSAGGGSSLSKRASASSKVVVTKPGKKASATVYIDSATRKSVKLAVKGRSAATGAWSVKNGKVASVSGKGRVTARKPGKTTVKVKYGNRAYSFKVMVRRVSISKANVTLGVGERLALTLNGDRVVNASSSYPSVAAVSKAGVVAAKSAGTAKVKLRSKKGKLYGCTVTVSAPDDTPSVNTQGKPEMYTVTFGTGDGGVVDSQVVEAGSHVSAPPEPTRAGYVFKGWFTDPGCTVEYDPTAAVTSDITLYEKWEKLPTIDLTASSAHALTGTGASGGGASGSADGGLVFYATAAAGAPSIESIELYDADSGERVLTMRDDGQYDAAGRDDIKGDGIFSGAYDASAPFEGARSFVARSGDEFSSSVTVRFYKPFTAKELELMEETDDDITDLTSGGTFLDADDGRKRDMAGALLDGLANKGNIIAGATSYHEEDKMFSYQYQSGVLGGLSLADFGTQFNGDYEGARIREEAAGGGGAGTGKPEKNGADEDGVLGKMLILNAFPSFTTQEADREFRTTFYNVLADSWRGKDYQVELKDSDVSVSDFKRLGDYAFVSISTHGGMYVSNGVQCPAISLSEDATPEKDAVYAAELKSGQLTKVNGDYWILPDFFKSQYREDALSDTFVFSETCDFVGRLGSYDYSMVNALASRGAKGVVGFHNAVYAGYSRELMESYASWLMDGRESSEAFDRAKSQTGQHHQDWAVRKGEPYSTSDSIAYPCLGGDDDAELISPGLVNGDFEETIVSGGASLVPRGWVRSGDTRSLTALGDISPRGADSRRMAVITTGIGSSSTSELANGTEGSRLAQSFVVPKDAKVLTFDYNFVSEEPPEYVGKGYNDAFVVRLRRDGDNVYSRMLESIDTSTWRYVNDDKDNKSIDFPQGDDTVCETGWKTGSIDVSAYAGKLVTLQFIVYDEGDSYYDSACLIDNVAVG